MLFNCENKQYTRDGCLFFRYIDLMMILLKSESLLTKSLFPAAYSSVFFQVCYFALYHSQSHFRKLKNYAMCSQKFLQVSFSFYRTLRKIESGLCALYWICIVKKIGIRENFLNWSMLVSRNTIRYVMCVATDLHLLLASISSTRQFIERLHY
jgi:hypothetical protein